MFLEGGILYIFVLSQGTRVARLEEWTEDLNKDELTQSAELMELKDKYGKLFDEEMVNLKLDGKIFYKIIHM